MNRPWMPLYIADYLADTGHLSTVEHGAYLLLIMHYWTKGALPNDDKKLANIAKLSAKQWSDIRSTIADFFQDGWHHKRIDSEMAKTAEKVIKRKASGKLGGIAKAAKNVANASCLPEQKPTNHNHSQIQKEEPPSAEQPRDAPQPVKSSITQEAFDLRDRLLILQKLDPDDPTVAIGAAYQVQTWLTNGWDAAAIVQGVETVMARQPGAPRSIRYFEPAIAQVIADRNRPLPVAAPSPVSNVHSLGGNFGTGSNRTYPNAGRGQTREDAILAGVDASYHRRQQKREQDRGGSVPHGDLLAIEHDPVSATGGDDAGLRGRG